MGNYLVLCQKRSILTIIEIHLHEGNESSETASGKQGCATLTRVCHWLVEFLERQQFGFITVVRDCTHLFSSEVLQPGKKKKKREAELAASPE